MNSPDEFLSRVLDHSLTLLKAQPVPIYTFAYYHDHESSAVSICVDTRESSAESVRGGNQWATRYFLEHIREGSLSDAKMFLASGGRSFSLGDFALVNLARTDLPPDMMTDDQFYLAMVRGLIGHQREILALSPEPTDVLFCCSTDDSEVGLIWTALQTS